jgi:hypothetical protein
LPTVPRMLSNFAIVLLRDMSWDRFSGTTTYSKRACET